MSAVGKCWEIFKVCVFESGSSWKQDSMLSHDGAFSVLQVVEFEIFFKSLE